MTEDKIHILYNDKGERVGWETESNRKRWGEVWNKHQLDILTGNVRKLTEEEKADNRKKLAWVSVNGVRTMCHVDNETMVAYEMEGMYERTNKVIPEYIFERWCTGFDV